MLGQPYRPPQVDATDYLGAQARGALAQTRNSAAQPRTPSLTGQPVHTSSARSPWLLRRPAPAPRREPSGTGCPARGCCVGRARPSCARKHASAARKLLEKPRGGRLGQSPGVGGKGGRWRGECCCRGCREMGAEPAILGLHPDDIIPSWDLEDNGGHHPGMTHSQTNKHLAPGPSVGFL